MNAVPTTRATTTASSIASIVVAAAAVVTLGLAHHPAAATTAPDSGPPDSETPDSGSPAPGPPDREPSTTDDQRTTAPPRPEISDEEWAAFDWILADRLVGNGGNQAASVAVSVDGVLVHASAFGARSPERPDAGVLATDRLRLASISKPITAIVALQLVAAGDLELDAPLGHRLAAAAGAPAVHESWAPVTLRQLLSHTAGVPKYRDHFFGGRFTSCEQAAHFGLERALARTPGTRHDYANLGYCLVGLLIADITGRSYEEAVAELLLEPLGINGMRVAGTVDTRPGEVVHRSSPDGTYMEALGAAGGWLGTPSDVVTILDSLDHTTPGWKPLPPHLAALMQRPVEGVSWPDPGARQFGLGVIVWPDGQWGHTGTVENTRAMLARRPDGVTWCIIVSGDRIGSTESLRDVFQRALDDAGITFAPS